MGRESRIASILFLSIFLFLDLSPLQHCKAVYNITPSQPLSQSQYLTSPGEVFELGFFIPNNSKHQYVGIWYKKISPPRIVWVANRETPLEVTDSLANLTISLNGNLELQNGKQNTVWSTNVSVMSNSTKIASLSDNGNLILSDGFQGGILWQSFDHLGDTFLPSTVVGFNVKTGEETNLVSWKNENDPSLGDFFVEIAPQRPPQAFIRSSNGLKLHWRSGPWDKSKFIGIPEMDTSYMNAFHLEEDVDQGTASFAFNTYNSSTVSNMIISPEGVLKLMRWNPNNSIDWYASWEAPKQGCDIYGTCGAFGVCRNNKTPICTCLKGFVPKSSEEWSNGNWSSGCVRRSELFCEQNTSALASKKGNMDGFWQLGQVKIPDFHEYVQLTSAEGCHQWCLRNCSCLAYAFVNGIGCLTWSRELVDIQVYDSAGEDLFLRLAHTELDEHGISMKVIVSITAVSGFIVLGIMLLGFLKWRANQKGSRKRVEDIDAIDILRDNFQGLIEQDPSELPFLPFDSIRVATDNFSVANKLGQGGFGHVYKGRLQDGKEIAVKRLASGSGQGIEEFKNEIILISKLQHRNLVKPMGCCIEGEEKLLIYEFMSNRSLDTFLFDPMKRVALDWPSRFIIIQGIAKGLLYLHRDSCLRIIHRDLKVSNILLDEKMNAKISDFGLARIFQETQDLANTHRVVGTLGYMSPEYALSGIFSEKSDVFSYGVLLLEIVSGIKNNNFHYNDQHLSLIAHAWQLWSEGNVRNLIDESMGDSYSPSEVMRCIHVGLLCVQDHAADRPSMPAVVFMLSSETDRPQPKEPTFTMQSLFPNELQSQSDIIICSLNGVTVSKIEGR